MKILELALTAFGPFTDTVLDLSAGHDGLHLVYGPNEAGKSSALRALRQALFGIPARSTDSFIHRNSDLRIGLALRSGTGQTLRFMRRKGSRNTLLTIDGTPLPESTVKRFLGGLTEAEFRTRFGIDHSELVQGGRLILQGGGELGSLLFQAGGGLKNLLDVQRQLERDFEVLFQPRGKNAKINAALAELKTVSDTKRRESLSSAQWASHERTWHEAAECIARIDRKLTAKRTERHRLERLASALPLFAQRATAESDLAALGDVVMLSEQFVKNRLEAQARREAAQIAARRACESLTNLDEQIAQYEPSEPIRAEAVAMEHVRDVLVANHKVRRALPTEEAKQLALIAAARKLIEEWWPHLLKEPNSIHSGEYAKKSGLDTAVDLVLEAGDQLRISRAQKAMIQSLCNERMKLAAEYEQALARLSKVTSEAQGVRTQLDLLSPPVDIQRLELALAQARDHGNLDQACQAAQDRVAGLENQTLLGLQQLPCWSGTLDVLRATTVPTPETIERFESELSRVNKEADRLRTDRQAAFIEQIDAEATLEQLYQDAGTIPSEEELARWRADRDELWRVIRHAWETDQAPAGGETTRHVPTGATDSRRALADSYELLKAEADACSDRLRREAGRIARRASALASLHRAKERLKLLDDQEKQVAELTDKLRAQWIGAWASTGFEPLSPREMCSWLQGYKDLMRQALELEDSRANLKALGRTHTALCQRLRECLCACGDVPSADDSLSGLRGRAEALLKRQTELENKRAHLSESRSALQEQAAAAEAQVHDLAERIEAWRGRWLTAVAPLGLSAEVSIDEVAEMLTAAVELQSKIKELRDTRARIAALKQESAQFSQEVRSLCQRFAPDLRVDNSPGSLSIEAAAQELLRRFREAQETWNSRQTLIEQREAQLSSLKEAERTCEEAELRLTALCREARCTLVDELPALEQRSEQARQLHERLKLLNDQIGQLRGNDPVDAFQQATFAIDLDALPNQLTSLTAEIAQLEGERDELNQTLGREREILRRMDGSSRAAEAAELAEELKARLVFDVEEYARLRLAAVVLQDAIERYRQRTQGPVLNRAAELFEQLTLGSFHGLKVAYDDHDQPVLHAVRAGGSEAVGIEGFSDGSADQLYLALRLASLETYLENHEPIPLVADDILIQFDDGRARAALQALGELSRRTQVVLFTHHEHVQGLAESCLDPNLLFIHHLLARDIGPRATTAKAISS